MTLADDYAAARQVMLDEQLRKRDIVSPIVLEAMARVPREQFAPHLDPDEAYADRAWPIDCGQTISQPYMVGAMTQALNLSGDEHVLEIGTGSGYQAAILAYCARSVVTVERHPALLERASEHFRTLHLTNIRSHVGDGTLGWPPEAPYDGILVTAAAEEIPPALLEQLAEGGILVIPLGGADGQILKSVRREQNRFYVTEFFQCRFVPLLPGEAEPE